MSPLANARTIPAGWSRHHAPVAEGAMNGRCRIFDPADDTTGWDAVNERPTLTHGAAVYDGPCRIEARLSANDVVQADDQETARDYLVQLVWDAAPIEEGWVLVPYECINDARLDGAVLRVDTEEVGTERFARDIFVTRVEG